MLKREENELVTRVGPGTPMGNTMRRYWMPALLASELPHPDSDPLRLRLLGEDLIAFRDTNGEVGLIQNNCPHRGASLFFGRNEEAGLRCVYHGWKFDLRATASTCRTSPPSPTSRPKSRPPRIRVRKRPASCGRIWARPTSARHCQTRVDARPRRPDALSRRPTKTATTCRPWKVGSIPRTPRSCTAT